MRCLHLIITCTVVALTTSLDVCGFNVSGTVFEEDSVTPIPGAKLFAYPRGDNDAVVPPVCVGQALAGQNGAYAITITGTARQYYIVARCNEVHDRYGLRVRKWITDQTTTAHVIMEEADDGFTTITGTITNTGGAPVSGAKVVLRTKISTGGTARFNVDSAVTGADGAYTITKAQVKVPEEPGEQVASLHIYATGYGDGKIDPLEMAGPSMTADYVLGSTGISFAGGNACGPYDITLSGKKLTLIVPHGTARLSVFTVNGAMICEKEVHSGKNAVSLNALSGQQVLIVHITGSNHTFVRKMPVVF